MASADRLQQQSSLFFRLELGMDQNPQTNQESRKNFQRLAARHSCFQEIAGVSAFSLGMVARFRETVEAHPTNYKRLFWEAGCVGQILYLEAEDMGRSATGIGCFMDNEMHEAFGLLDVDDLGRWKNDFQSLYHFTVGGRVDDPRIGTLPPYWHLEKVLNNEDSEE